MNSVLGVVLVCVFARVAFAADLSACQCLAGPTCEAGQTVREHPNKCCQYTCVGPVGTPRNCPTPGPWAPQVGICITDNCRPGTGDGCPANEVCCDAPCGGLLCTPIVWQGEVGQKQCSVKDVTLDVGQYHDFGTYTCRCLGTGKVKCSFNN